MRMLSTIDTTRSVRNLLNSIFMAKLRQRRERIFGWYNNVLACASIYLHNIHLKAVQHRRLGRRRRCWFFFLVPFFFACKAINGEKKLISIFRMYLFLSTFTAFHVLHTQVLEYIIASVLNIHIDGEYGYECAKQIT